MIQYMNKVNKNSEEKFGERKFFPYHVILFIKFIFLHTCFFRGF